MIRYSNEDYRTPRQRGMQQNGMRRQYMQQQSVKANAEPARMRYDCSGAPVADNCSVVPEGCGGNPSLAAVYSPKQTFTGLYPPPEAFYRGTLFSALDLPWKGGMA